VGDDASFIIHTL